jgi:hypothetical protein
LDGELCFILRKPKIEQQIKPIAPEAEMLANVSVQENKQPESWEPEISELELYFTKIQLPKEPVKLNSYSTIANVSKFLDTHFRTLKANNGKRRFLPYLNRLQELKQNLHGQERKLQFLKSVLAGRSIPELMPKIEVSFIEDEAGKYLVSVDGRYKKQINVSEAEAFTQKIRLENPLKIVEVHIMSHAEYLIFKEEFEKEY